MSSIPAPVLFLLGTATESILITSVVPHEYLPTPPLSRVFVRLLILQFILYAIWRVGIRPLISPLRHLPQVPAGTPFFGHMAAIFERPAGKSAAQWMKTVPNDGLLMMRGIFNTPQLIATNPAALSELLVTRAYDFEKPARLRNFLREAIGDGLIIVEGDVHKFQRKNIMPVFTFRNIKELYGIFWSKSAQLTEGVAQQLAENREKDGEVVEINHWANQVTMDIIGLAAMGRDLQALRNGHDPLIVNYEELLEPTKGKQFWFFLGIMLGPAIATKLPWSVARNMSKAVDNVNRMCLELVKEKREMMKTDTESKDLLSLLIRSNNFDDKQLADQMLTFLAAGHETTSSAFTWSTFLLAKNPDIQKALREEIHKNMPSPTDPVPTGTDIAAILESLPILNGVCQEVTRLYPTVPRTVRCAIRDTELVGHKIPKNTFIQLVPYAINRDPQFWGKDADEFKPERWIDTDPATGERRPNKNGGAPSNFNFLTFLHGPRSCIGQGFAQAELRALVAAFAGTFEMEMADPNEEVVASGTITTKPNNGMHLRLKHLGAW